jgi:hypothetical protein
MANLDKYQDNYTSRVSEYFGFTNHIGAPQNFGKGIQAPKSAPPDN